MNSPKVLHLVLKSDGITDVVVEDINIGLIEGGCDVTMVCLRDNQRSLHKTVANRAIALGIATGFRFAFDWLATRRLSELLCDNRYDVVISHRYKPCMVTMKLVRKFPGVQFVNVVHGTSHYDQASRKRAIMRRAHERFRFVCVSEAVADFVRNEVGVGSTVSPVQVIANGIDIQSLADQQLTREDARRELGLDSTSTWICFAGRLIKIKGVCELIEGFAQVAKEYPAVKLAILGQGELRQDLEKRIEMHGLRDRVLLHGQVPRARRYFKAFDAFVLPSHREGMSIALLEAMATGLPLLVSDIPMNTALVDENTIVFKAHSSAAVSAALHDFLKQEPGTWVANGKVNRLLAEKKYDIKVFRQNYLDLVRSLCGSSARRAIC